MNGSPWLSPGAAQVLALVERRAGLMSPSCPAAAQEGILRAMVRAGHGADDFAGYLERLARDAAALDDLLTELTIGETYFFRNPEHYEFVRTRVLPELRERRGPASLVRVWSAGCASGEEPYSLAVLLREEGWGERMQVLATDVSRAALHRAAQARYSPWSLRGEGAERMRPFLQPDDRHFVLAPEVRQRVRFEYLNLAQDDWPSIERGLWALDLIFCRNVLIYFNRPTVAAVARRLYASLAPGGYLLMGPSDPSLQGLVPLEPLLTDWGVAFRRPTSDVPLDAHTPPPLPGGPLTPLPLPRGPYTPLPLPASRSRAPLPPSPTPSPTASGPRAPPSASAPALQGARNALARGDWREAARLAGALEADPQAATVSVRALANLDVQAAVRACAEALARHPLSAELRYLHALLLLSLGQLAPAEAALNQALYLEPTLAVAHLLLSTVLRRRGERRAALRALRTAESLCAALPADAPVPLADSGERAGQLAAAARAERTRLEAALEEEHEP